MNFNKRNLDRAIRRMSSPPGRIYHKCLLWIVRITVFGGIAAVLLLGAFGAGTIRSLLDRAPDIAAIDETPLGEHTQIFDSSGNLIQTLVAAGANRESVSIDQIPENLRQAFICIEDERFLEHDGIDLKGILRAAFRGITSGDFSEGASTITQQWIKNRFFEGGREKGLGAQIERKVMEQAMALAVENTHSKNIILENYLNTINLGNNTLGVQAASKRYFNKSVSDLTLSECAVIAAITQNPSRFNPIRFPEYNRERRDVVLEKMKNAGVITTEEYDEAIADDVYSRVYAENPNAPKQSVYSYYTDALIQVVLSDLQNKLGYTQQQAWNMLYSGGLKIQAALDSDIQKIMDDTVNDPTLYPYTYYSLNYRANVTSEDGSVRMINEDIINNYALAMGKLSNGRYYTSIEAIEETIRDYNKSHDITEENSEVISYSTTLDPQVSMVILEQSTGHVVAICGGRGEKPGSLTLNRATDTTRQPGSCFKVLSTFAPYLDTMGGTLGSTIYAGPYSYQNHDINDWWGSECLGYVNVRDCIAYSMNLGTMHFLMDQVGINVAYDYLQKLGITTLVDSRRQADGTVLTDRVPSICLGGIVDGVTNLELTNAYATIANQGTYTEPIYYTRITDRNGKVILENEPNRRKVLKSTTATLLTYAMESTMQPASASKYTDINPNIIPTGGDCVFDGVRLAGKSGSTTDQKDLWFVGYTPYYTCGVWSGYDVGQAEEAGGIYHKLIWREVMSKIHSSLPDREWGPESSDIVKAKICSKSGKLAIDGVCDHEDTNAVVYTEYFTRSTVPHEYCDCHKLITICTESDKPANDDCPKEGCEDHVFMILDEKITSLEVDSDDIKHALPDKYKDVECDVHKPEPTTEADTEESEDETE